jgi:hypothetical protein
VLVRSLFQAVDFLIFFTFALWTRLSSELAAAAAAEALPLLEEGGGGGCRGDGETEFLLCYEFGADLFSSKGRNERQEKSNNKEDGGIYFSVVFFLHRRLGREARAAGLSLKRAVAAERRRGGVGEGRFAASEA